MEVRSADHNKWEGVVRESLSDRSLGGPVGSGSVDDSERPSAVVGGRMWGYVAVEQEYVEEANGLNE